MSARKFTTDELITKLRDIGAIPASGVTGSENADLVVALYDAMMEHIVPRLQAVRKGYFLQRQKVALGTTSRYRIPHRAMYGRLKELWYWDSASNRYRLTEVDSKFRSRIQEPTSEPLGYYLEGDYLVLLPEAETAAFSGYLEEVFFMRPGELVLEASVGTINSVDTGTKVITCTADVSGIFSAGDSIDVHSPYSGAELKEWDLTVTDVTTTDITVSEAIDGSTFGRKAIAAGDYVTLAETAVLPALPRELHSLVARAAALNFAESLGDTAQAQLHGAMLEKQLGAVLGLAKDRVETQPEVLGVEGWM